MTRALAHVKSNPSLLYMMLSHNRDIVSACYLAEALTSMILSLFDLLEMEFHK
jgi:hypothetical protein